MIFYFSGTGNSAYVAKKIAKETGEALYSINDSMKKGKFFDYLHGNVKFRGNTDVVEKNNETCYIFVLPTYSWRIPNVVEEWIIGSSFEKSIKAYFILTCGDSIGNAAPYAEKLCIDKKLTYMGCGEVVMPENYISLFNAPDEAGSKEIIKKAQPKINKLISLINMREPFVKEPVGIAGRIESSLVHWIFYRTIVKDRKFKTDSSCTGCGICASECPVNNIALKKGSPVWKGNCTHCMACITCCPQESIEYGRKSMGQPRYRCPDIE